MTKKILNGSSALRGLPLMAMLVAPMAATADQSVTLKSQDGTVDLMGELISFDQNFYLVNTALGQLRLSAERVRCEGAACPAIDTNQIDVTFAGSDIVGAGVLPLMLEGFAGHINAEATVTATDSGSAFVASLVGDAGFGDDIGSFLVNSSGSTDAFSALMNQTANIGMSSRRIRPEEAAVLREVGAGDMESPAQEHIVAIDSIVVITHPENPVQQVSMEQLADIYAGRITNWAQLGGDNLAIKIVDRPKDSGTHNVFIDRVFDGKDSVSANVMIAQENADVANIVNDHRAAIGYTGYAFQRGAKALTLVNECGLSMVPDAFSARTEEYALQRRLYLYNRSDSASPRTQEFLAFAASPEADSVIVKAGFIDLGIDRRAQPFDSERARQLLATSDDPLESSVMREMLSTMVNYDRLSTTFRFTTGSSDLDERAIVDMERLTTFLEDMPAGTKIKVVGFTDEVGEFANNAALAQGRAAQVQAELAAFGGARLSGIEMETAAYGEVAPSACNATDAGRAINRRVEIWIESQA